uniref:Ubiquitin-like protease family profile domain-containing protein n=1 Tax=Ditylenchus dipsaci TaxID=166011 RepID=A0A915EPY2_9BILA
MIANRQKIRRMSRLGDRAKLVVSRFSIELTNDDMCRLEPGKLINDNIIDYYLQLVSYRSKQNLFYQSGVRAVLGWTRHEDIFEQDILLIPIHLPGHWALVAVKIKKHRLIYYDSLLGDGHICLSLIKKYLEQESMQRDTKKKIQLMARRSLSKAIAMIVEFSFVYLRISIT